MVKEKIANFIGHTGILLGVIVGMTVVCSELYLSPMSYTESYFELVIYFYSFSAIIAVFFLMLRLFIIGRIALRLCLFLLFIASFHIFLYGQEWEKMFLLSAAGLLFPLLMGDLFFKPSLKNFRISALNKSQALK